VKPNAGFERPTNFDYELEKIKRLLNVGKY
jgi:hypothetical protein